MKKLLFIPFVAAAMMTSCCCDKELSGSDNKFIGNVTFMVEPFLFDDTRSSLTDAGDSIAFAWDNGGAVGAFPVAPVAGVQTKLALKDCSDNTTISSFYVSGWKPTSGNTYAAYYPFQNLLAETSHASIPVVMTGQTQDGNASLAHIGGRYDYMYAVSGVPTNGDMNFEFKHVTSVVMLEVTMPDTATLISFTLSDKGGKDVFTTSATMNVATGVVTPVETSPEFTLSLNNIRTTETSKTLTLYLSVLPTTTDELTLTAKSSSCKVYKATIAGKTFVAGKAYRVTGVELVDTTTGTENGHEWVDLGLPSGIRWATMNLGATSVEDYGKQYAWGETKAYGEEDPSNLTNYNTEYSYTKSIFNFTTYKWCNGSASTLTKYCTDSRDGTVDNKTTLDPEDDAAIQNWGGAWRMPTEADFDELLNNCYWVWTDSYNGSKIVGYIVYAVKSTSDKGKIVYEGETPSDIYSLSDTHIFIPASGFRGNSPSYYPGVWGNYWTTRCSSIEGRNLFLRGEIIRYSWDYRYLGFSVRACL